MKARERAHPSSVQHSTSNIQHSTFRFSKPLRIRLVTMKIATRVVTRGDHHPSRLVAEADIHDVGAARVELAATRQIRDRWDHPFNGWQATRGRQVTGA